MSRPTEAPLSESFFSGGSNITDAGLGLQRYLNETEARVNARLTTGDLTLLEAFTNEGGLNPRPDPNTVPVGTVIFNTDDNAPNYADGAASPNARWRDAAGLTT